VASEEALLARATLYRLAAQAFRHPGEAWRAEWDEIAHGVSAALEVLAHEDRARPAAERSMPPALFDAFDLLWASSRDLEALRRDHARLVGHSPRAGTTPYETEWTGAAGEILQYHELADLSGCYQAFGLELAPACDERADHLAIELVFMAFLCVKEALAAEQGRAEDAATVRAAQRAFLEGHLLRWVGSFAARVEREDPSGFYGRAAALLEHFLAAERRRFGLRSDSVERELAASSMTLEDCCVGCEHARGCAGPVAPAPEVG
jgi:DMSO reductase family type II enzyme chaperone